MKKTVSLILALVLCLSLCACSGTTDSPASDESDATSASTEVTDASEEIEEEDTYAEVEAALLGQWGLCIISDHPSTDVYEFREDGKGTWLSYTQNSYNYEIEEGFSWKITYEITEDKILYQYPSVSTGELKDGEFSYTFDGETLRLYERYYESTVEYIKDNDWLDVVIEKLRDDGLDAIREDYPNYFWIAEE